MKIAIVGCGNIAERYAPRIAEEDSLELVGVTDPVRERAEQVAAALGVTHYASLEELLGDDAVETVVNLTPPHTHAQVTAAALEAGKHVHTEKPLALRHEEAQELVERAQRNGLRLSCAPVTLLGEAQQTAWKLLREGAVGDVRVVYAEANWGRIESWHPSPQALYAVGPTIDVGVAVNSFEGFGVDRAKHFVPCTPDGYVIGDVILFALGENRFNLVGRAPALNWITYHAETGGYDVSVELDLRTALRSDGRRRSYRFQLQGPNAMQITERVLGEAPPELKFFRTTTLTIAGKSVGALRHGMVGQPGWELFGPWDDREAVLEAILVAGEEFGLRRSGGRAYSSNTLESGWIPSPLPAVYSGASLQAYREWLPAQGYEGSASVGGSFDSADIEDYYFTPWDLGYGSYVKFDHDFIGREALERLADEEHRHKVTLALDDDDVTRTIGTMLQKDGRAKFIDWPSAVYSMHQFDRVTIDGETVGVSTWIGYSSNEGKMLTLAVLDAEHAEPGTGVTLVWGEEDGGTTKPTVEPHVQVEIGAVVCPVPYVETVRTSYAPGGWRASRA